MKKKTMLLLLNALFIVAMHLFANHLIVAQSGWTVLPPLSAIPPEGLQVEGGIEFTWIRVCSIIEGALIFSFLYLVLKKTP